MSELIVASFLWFDKARQRSYAFEREDVRIWDQMISRNLTIPHRRVCVTHRPDLVEDFIEVIPIDPAKHVPGLCTVKLQAHKIGGVAKEGDRVLLLDIDVVVTGSLDEIVKRDEPYVFWKNPNFEIGGRRGFIQGSVQLFTVGATEFLWRDFDPKSTLSWLNRRFGGAEQCWISERLNANYPEVGWDWSGVPLFTEEDGIRGAGRMFRDQIDNGLGAELPYGTKLVAFPGDRSPSQPNVQRDHPWLAEHYR